MASEVEERECSCSNGAHMQLRGPLRARFPSVPAPACSRSSGPQFGRRELSELRAVRLGLSQEFESYPAELQRQIRPAYRRIDSALGRVIAQLQDKIERGGAEGDEGQLEGE